MARKKKYNYFDAFGEQIDIALKQAKMLADILDDYDNADTFAEIIEKAHEIENAGDDINRKTFSAIAMDFITPFDRDDIIDISSSLDDIVDKLESTLRLLYMMDVHVVHPSSKEQVALVIKCLKAMRVAQDEFHDFKRSGKFKDAVKKVNDIEEQADDLYMEAMHTLYADESDDPIHVMKWSRIFDKLEECCDACEHVCDVMSSVILKSS